MTRVYSTRHMKRSPYCSDCKLDGRRRKAVRNSNGGYQSYCREHKNARARDYMFERRIEDPNYGQVRRKHGR